MGYNTTVIILNDELDSIARDPEFGSKLKDAILGSGRYFLGNAAIVVESHHSYNNTIIAVGGNCATVLGFDHGGTHHKFADYERIVRTLAGVMGFDLVKK